MSDDVDATIDIVKVGWRGVIITIITQLACGRIDFELLPEGEDVSSVFQEVGLPTGGQFHRLAIADDGHVYTVAASGRIYASSDLGPSWSPCGAADGSFLPLTDIGVDGDGVVWAATGGGVRQSDDRCATWAAAYDSELVTAIAVAGPNIVIGEYGIGLVMRTSTGWARVPTALDGEWVTALAASADGASIYAATYSGRSIRTLDGGQTWSAPLPGITAPSPIWSLAVDPTNTSRAYATTSGGPLHVLAGAAWMPLGADSFGSFAMDPGNPSLMVYQGVNAVHGSVDGGASFTPIAWPENRAMISDAEFDPSGTGRLLITTERGVYAATDATFGWVDASRDLHAWTINDLTITGTGSTFATTRGGLLRRRPGEAVFSVVDSPQALRSYVFWHGAVSGVGAAELYVLGFWLYRSLDDGDSFDVLFDPDQINDGVNVRALAVVGDRLFVGTRGRFGRSDAPHGVNTWTMSTVAGTKRAVNAIVALDATRVIVATDTGLFVTTDAGATFADVSGAIGASDVRAIVKLDAGVWLVGGVAGAFASPSIDVPVWTRVPLDGEVWDLQGDGTRVYATTARSVYWSDDAGESWHELRGLADRQPRALAFDATGQLLVGTDGWGVHVTIPPRP